MVKNSIVLMISWATAVAAVWIMLAVPAVRWMG